MGRGCGVGVKVKVKYIIVFFWDFSAFLLLFIDFLAFISLLLWDEDPNGTSVPYLFLKIKRKF